MSGGRQCTRRTRLGNSGNRAAVMCDHGPWFETVSPVAHIVLAPSWIGTVFPGIPLKVDAHVLRRPAPVARGLGPAGALGHVLAELVAVRAAVLAMTAFDAAHPPGAQHDAAPAASMTKESHARRKVGLATVREALVAKDDAA